MPLRMGLFAPLILALAALLAAACTTTTDDEQEEEQAVATAAETAAADAARAEAAAATPISSQGPRPAAPAPISQGTRRGESSGAPVTAPAAAEPPARMERVDLEARIRADFAEFQDVAWTALPTSPNHVLAWGIGAPSGDRYLIPVRVYDAATGAMLREVALGGGPLRSADSVVVSVAEGRTGTLIEAHGETGAHGVTHDVLAWNGTALTVAASNFSDVPGNSVAPGRAARLEDLDGDHIHEVIADRTDGYPFWYASGVYRGDAAVLRWDEYAYAEVELTLDEAMHDDVREHTLMAMELAEAGWLRYAASLAAAAAWAEPDNETVAWNALVLEQRAMAAEATAAESPLAWAGAAINGDWAEAVEVLRRLGAQALVEPDAAFTNSPLESGREDAIVAIGEYAEAAIAGGGSLSEAELAPAWLILGLTQWWDGEGYEAAEESLLEAIPGYWDGTFLFDLMYYMRISE